MARKAKKVDIKLQKRTVKKKEKKERVCKIEEWQEAVKCFFLFFPKKTGEEKKTRAGVTVY